MEVRRSLGCPPRALRGAGSPASAENNRDQRLEIAVIVTSPERTVSALRAACNLLRGLDGRVVLIDAQPIHYSSSLENPPLSLGFTKRKLLMIACQSTVELEAKICFCRSRLDAIGGLVKRDSPVVVGVPKSWWPSWERKLAGRLRRLGYHVIVLQA